VLAKRAYDAALGDRVVRRAARVIAVSAAERKQFGTLAIPPQRIRTLPNPVNLDEFDPPPQPGAFRRRIGWTSGRLVLFLGQLSPRKRVDVLVRAFARLDLGQESRLVIAGNDMGAAGRIRRVARETGVLDRTIFAGLLRAGERCEALADADVVVYPSQDEVFGLVPLEALLCHTPVVVADDSGCGEVVRNVGGGQLTPVGDPEILSRAIRAVLDDIQRWRAAAIDAAGRIGHLYGGDVVSASLEAVYSELVAA
jgi:glycosyltransferase involved in cell wall biosynthesis